MGPELMSDASRDAAKLQQALISCGVALSAAALSLIIFKAPGGIFLRLHGGAPFYLYYGSLVVFATFGFAQAAIGSYHATSTAGVPLERRLLWVSILALVIVAALGGDVFLKL
ncbi:unnamed protein product [Urochloa humidicola]